MADSSKLMENLRRRGFAAAYFETSGEAVDYLDGKLDGEEIGIAGSMTIQKIGLHDRLNTHNHVYWTGKDRNLRAKAAAARVFLSSLNGVAETGELINIDMAGNRVAPTIFGPEKVYFIIGVNKIAPDYDAALWRARNIAAPKNARRLNYKTPCAINGDKCYNCSSPDRICRALVVLWEKPAAVREMEIIIINQELGL